MANEGKPSERNAAPAGRQGWLARAYLWATRRLYNELAWAYDLASWLVSLGRWSGWRRQALEHVAGLRVLEIGFGTGELLIEMAQRGWQVCGLEPSMAMQQVTARKMRRRGVQAPRLRALAQAMPFTGASLDAIIATFPAEYILAPATWQEVARLLRPDGRLIIAGLFVEIAPTSGAAARSTQAVEAAIGRLAASAGLALSVFREEGARVRSPVFVCEKRPS